MTSEEEQRDWRGELDRMTAEHAGDLVTIEILDPALGYQHEARRLPFSEISFDPKDDVVVIAVGGTGAEYPVVLRHMVWHPSEVDVAADEVPQPAVRVVEPDGTTTLVVFYPGDDVGTQQA
jgi:hypothetical protein